jgi:hypothetical protein
MSTPSSPPQAFFTDILCQDRYNESMLITRSNIINSSSFLAYIDYINAKSAQVKNRGKFDLCVLMLDIENEGGGEKYVY